MMPRRTYLLLIAIFLSTPFAKGQIFDDSQAHYKIDWQQIRHPKFDLIFPKEFASHAPKLARQIEDFIGLHERQFSKPIRKIKIILQHNHVEQNGFMQLAPRKSELYSVQSAQSTNQEWLPNLALHELRHTAQFDNITGKLKSPLFEQLGLALFGITIPSWYFEGDAVWSETYFSDAGRGRLASWNMPIRTILKEDRSYSFNKYVHGSFKDVVPSYYTIGYLMNSYLYEQKKNGLHEVFTQLRKHPIRLNNFNKSLKSTYGLTSTPLFERTIAQLRSKWTNPSIQNHIELVEIKDKYPTDYILPQQVHQEIYSLRISQQQTAQVIKWNKNNLNTIEKVINIGLQLAPYFHIQENLITWDEVKKHPRYDKETYSVIQLYDTITKKQKTISAHSRLYSPVISKDLNTLLAVGIDSTNTSYLALYDLKTNTWLEKNYLPKGLHFIQPQFHTTNNKIIGIGITSKGTNLLEIQLDDLKITPLLEWSNLQLERPYYKGDEIIFKANQEGKDDLFIWKLGKNYKLTSSTYGAFNPSIYKDSIWYNDYQINGYKVATQAIPSTLSGEVTLSKAKSLYDSQETRVNEPLDTVNSYTIVPYKAAKNLFNFHSLSLSGNDFESFDNFRPGIFWLSNNILNTTRTKIGYEYDLDTRKSLYSAEITFQRWYPKFNVSYLNRAQIGTARNSQTNQDFNFEWREHVLNLELQLPFSIYKKNFVYSYGVNFGTSYLNRYQISVNNLKNFDTDIIFPLNYQAYFNRNAMRSRMDIIPRWGQNISFTYRHIPFDNEASGMTWSIRSIFYLPGIKLNHGLQIRTAVQESNGRYQYLQDIPMIDGFAFTKVERIRNTLLFNYHFPIAYPDWSIGQLAYIKRIRGVAGAHYQNIENQNLQPNAMSIGASLDFNMFKYTLPNFSVDMKATYLNKNIGKQTWVPTFSFNYSY